MQFDEGQVREGDPRGGERSLPAGGGDASEVPVVAEVHAQPGDDAGGRLGARPDLARASRGPKTSGEDVNWYRNIVAAGGCELMVGGQWHQVAAIEPYPSGAGREAFGYPARLVLQVLQRHEFWLLRTA